MKKLKEKKLFDFLKNIDLDDYKSIINKIFNEKSFEHKSFIKKII